MEQELKELAKGAERTQQTIARLNATAMDHAEARAALEEQQLQLEFKLTGDVKVMPNFNAR